MNMNRSGHGVMRDPEWYARSTDRAKLSPTTEATEGMQNSLTSLNLDSFADLDHFSVRSLPVLPSNGTNSIATSVDAPWNESPRSTRSSNRFHAAAPPSGMSALDHLQNSISSLNNGSINGGPPMHAIGILEVDDDDDTTHNFEASLASIRESDWNEMDATAHAGNITRGSATATANTTTSRLPPMSPQRASTNNSAYQHQHVYPPLSPQRSLASPQRSLASPVRRAGVPELPMHNNTSDASSYAGSSITSRGSTRYHRYATYNNTSNNEPSLSTLGDDDDEEFDDDNLEIIKVLRKQVGTLKQQLLAEQTKNQDQKAVLEQMNSSRQRSFGNDSSTCFGHDFSDCDSFGEEDPAKDAAAATAANATATTTAASGTTTPAQQQQAMMQWRACKKTNDAHDGVMASISALRKSFETQQQAAATAAAVSAGNGDEPTDPVIESSSMDASSVGDEHLLMDELVLCELESHLKTVLTMRSNAVTELQQKNAGLVEQQKAHDVKIAELERQLAAATAATATAITTTTVTTTQS